VSPPPLRLSSPSRTLAPFSLIDSSSSHYIALITPVSASEAPATA
jgi:hypothetical protein